MENQPTATHSSHLSIGNTSLTSRNFYKKAKNALQLMALSVLLIMFFMNLFRGDANSAQTSQLLYKILEMPQIGALGTPVNQHPYEHVPRNRTPD